MSNAGRATARGPGRVGARSLARSPENVAGHACMLCTYCVSTIGLRKGGIAGSRGRHRGGEPLCCLRATKTMRRHQAARDAPRRLRRSSLHTLVPCTHHVRSPSSGDGGEARRHRRKNKPEEPLGRRRQTRGPRSLVLSHARTPARTHVILDDDDGCTHSRRSYRRDLSRPLRAVFASNSRKQVRWRAYTLAA